MDFAIEYSVPVTVLYDSKERQISRVIIHDDCLSDPGRVTVGDCDGIELTPKRRAVVIHQVEHFNDLWPAWEFGW